MEEQSSVSVSDPKIGGEHIQDPEVERIQEEETLKPVTEQPENGSVQLPESFVERKLSRSCSWEARKLPKPRKCYSSAPAGVKCSKRSDSKSNQSVWKLEQKGIGTSKTCSWEADRKTPGRVKTRNASEPGTFSSSERRAAPSFSPKHPSVDSEPDSSNITVETSADDEKETPVQPEHDPSLAVMQHHDRELRNASAEAAQRRKEQSDNKVLVAGSEDNVTASSDDMDCDNVVTRSSTSKAETQNTDCCSWTTILLVAGVIGSGLAKAWYMY